MPERATLSNGHAVDLRLANPDDFDTVREFYRALDDEATYYRFFGIRRQLPEHELRNVVGAADSHVTMLALTDGRLIGLGEYIIGSEPDEAEVAFAVADDHHREGVATLLLERLAVIAHARGLQRFTAAVLPGNADMRLVFRTVGLTTSNTFDDGIVNVTLDLTTLSAMRDAARTRSRPMTLPSDARGNTSVS